MGKVCKLYRKQEVKICKDLLEEEILIASCFITNSRKGWFIVRL